MTTRTRPRLALLFPLLCVVAATAQQAGSPPLETGHPEPPASRTIRLNVVVTPKSGAPVTGLQEKDFTVLDNKVPQTITSFRAYDGSQEPVEVILLIDSVNASFSNVAYERTEIDKFLHADDGHLTHPTTLAVLGDKGVQIQQGFTRDGNAVAASFDQFAIALRTITRSTGFYGAAERFQLSINALSQLAAREAARPGRKIILWVSPGWPLLSGPRMELDNKQEQALFDRIVSMSTQLRQAGITVYNVNPLGVSEGLGRTFYYEEYLKGVTKPNDANIANLGLQVIATQSGGLVLSSSDISGLLKQCVADTGAYYKLSFEPPPTERKDVYHHLEIQVPGQGMTARTSTGYYAEP
jgi:VWFA-related protein